MRRTLSPMSSLEKTWVSHFSCLGHDSNKGPKAAQRKEELIHTEFVSRKGGR